MSSSSDSNSSSYSGNPVSNGVKKGIEDVSRGVAATVLFGGATWLGCEAINAISCAMGGQRVIDTGKILQNIGIGSA